MKKKITVGTVIQTFDENNKCVEQEFIAGAHDVDPQRRGDAGSRYEDADGNSIEAWDEYQPFDMVQPQVMLNEALAIHQLLAKHLGLAEIKKDDPKEIVIRMIRKK